MLELRLDNVVFRAGWAATRPQARQFVSHGLVDVNGRGSTSPATGSARATSSPFATRPESMIVVRHNLDTLDRCTPAWLETGDGGFQVTVRELPLREQIDVPVREQLIVELYSK